MGSDKLTTSSRDEQLIDVSRARLLLGGISTATLYRLVADDHFPIVKVRRRTFFRRIDLLRYIDRSAEGTEGSCREDFRADLARTRSDVARTTGRRA